MTKAGHTLTVWLAERTLRKQVFAEKIGVSKWELSRFINGVKMPSADVRATIETETEGRVRIADWNRPMEEVTV